MEIIITIIWAFLVGMFLGRLKRRVFVESKEKPNDKVKHTKQNDDFGL